MSQSLVEKLQMQDEKTLLLQGIPSTIEKQFSKVSFSKNVTPLLKSKKVDFVLVFAISLNQLNNILSDVFGVLHKDSKLWIAYPKPTSKIASDLNRDFNWPILMTNHFESINQIELDHVWSAIHFKRSDEASVEPEDKKSSKSVSKKAPAEKGTEEEPKKEVKNTVKKFNKHMNLSPELESLFGKNRKAKDFFTSLSFSNQKEYMSWIEEAKRSDTRAKRLEATVKKLLAGKKSPLEK